MVFIIIIVLLILKYYPRYKEEHKEKRRYFIPVDSTDNTFKSEGKSNGDLPTCSDTDVPKPIEPYPSNLPPSDDPKVKSKDLEPETSARDIPEDLEMNDDDNDSDTLLKKEDMVKPKSYDHLPSKDSAV